jgi:hypothetical protein
MATCQAVSAVLPPTVHKEFHLFGANVFRKKIKSKLTLNHPDTPVSHITDEIVKLLTAINHTQENVTVYYSYTLLHFQSENWVENLTVTRFKHLNCLSVFQSKELSKQNNAITYL